MANSISRVAGVNAHDINGGGALALAIRGDHLACAQQCALQRIRLHRSVSDMSQDFLFIRELFAINTCGTPSARRTNFFAQARSSYSRPNNGSLEGGASGPSIRTLKFAAADATAAGTFSSRIGVRTRLISFVPS